MCVVSSTQQRVVLHVGLPKSGTTYLQGLLAANRDRLRAAGILYPFLRPGAQFHGAVEVRGSHAKFGLSADDVAGTWAALCARARSFEGTTIISHEVLAGASPDEVRAALEPLAGLEVHVVVTARDLGRQSVAHWQEEVKLGATYSFAEFEATQLRADTGGGDRPHFWHAQDFAACLRRWSTGHAHLVTLPRPGADPAELWRRFAAAAGIDPGVLDPTDQAPANPSLGTAEIALLRAVNAGLVGRVERGEYLRVVKRGYAEGELATRPGPRPVAPHDLAEVLGAATAAWLAQVEQDGVAVHGDPADLAPVLGGPGDPRPDDVALPEDPASVIRALAAQLR
ncbi:hypothetical protein GCM10023146_21160 [Nocardioides caricicola]